MTSILQKRVRGFRVLEVFALCVLLALIVTVYLFKTVAGRERAEIAKVERQIAAEHRQMKLLRAEVAHLEQPERLERLSTQYLGLGAVAADREAKAATMADLAQAKQAGAK